MIQTQSNIAYGKGGDATEAEVIVVAEKSNVHQFIAGLQQGISCISGEESSRISLGMCSPLREERNGQITAKKRSKPGFFPVEACAPAQQC
ncbi:hypothetical protein AgCh_024588 [Apium graveolens]